MSVSRRRATPLRGDSYYERDFIRGPVRVRDRDREREYEEVQREYEEVPSSRRRSIPDFLRDDYGNSDKAPLVVRQRTWERNGRSPSPIRVVERRRAREYSPPYRSTENRSSESQRITIEKPEEKVDERANSPTERVVEYTKETVIEHYRQVDEIVWDLSRTKDVTLHLELDITEDLDPYLDQFSRFSKTGDYHKAEQFFREHLEDHQDDPYVFVQYAQMLLEMGRYRDINTLKVPPTLQDSKFKLLHTNWSFVQYLSSLHTGEVSEDERKRFALQVEDDIRGLLTRSSEHNESRKHSRIIEESTTRVASSPPPPPPPLSAHDPRIARHGSREDQRSLWTEITKDLVSREVLEAAGENFEETEHFFYVMRYLTYEEVLGFVEATKEAKSKDENKKWTDTIEKRQIMMEKEGGKDSLAPQSRESIIRRREPSRLREREVERRVREPTTKDWTIVDVPPGSRRVRMSGFYAQETRDRNNFDRKDPSEATRRSQDKEVQAARIGVARAKLKQLRERQKEAAIKKDDALMADLKYYAIPEAEAELSRLEQQTEEGERRVPDRPAFLRRHSSLETFDRRPIDARVEREEYGPPSRYRKEEYRPRTRFAERDYEDIRLDRRDYYSSDEDRNVPVRVRERYRRSLSPIRSTETRWGSPGVAELNEENNALGSTECQILSIGLRILAGIPRVDATVGAGHASWKLIYDELLRQGRIWDFRDIFSASILYYGTLNAYEEFLPGVDSPLDKIVADWSTATFDESTSLALLDILISVMLCESPLDSSISGMRQVADISSTFASSLVQNDSSKLKSRQYIRWVLAKITATSYRDIFLFKASYFPGLFLERSSALELPIYVPKTSELADWSELFLTTTTTGTLEMITKAAKELGDLETEALCLKQLILHSEDPADNFNQLIRLQKDTQGDIEGCLRTSLSKYIICRDKLSRDKLRLEILLMQDCPPAETRLEWAKRMILSSLAVSEVEAALELSAASEARRLMNPSSGNIVDRVYGIQPRIEVASGLGEHNQASQRPRTARDNLGASHIGSSGNTHAEIIDPFTPQRENETSPKGILHKPREAFPEDPTPIREGVAPPGDARKDGVPPDARWTKISRELVSPRALEAGKERFEARKNYVIVLRVLSRDEIQGYAEATKRIRAARREGEESAEEGEPTAKSGSTNNLSRRTLDSERKINALKTQSMSETVRDVETKKKDSPSRSPSPPIPMRAPPIHQEIITHHRHIEHGKEYPGNADGKAPDASQGKDLQDTFEDSSKAKGNDVLQKKLVDITAGDLRRGLSDIANAGINALRNSATANARRESRAWDSDSYSASDLSVRSRSRSRSRSRQRTNDVDGVRVEVVERHPPRRRGSTRQRDRSEHRVYYDEAPGEPSASEASTSRSPPADRGRRLITELARRGLARLGLDEPSEAQKIRERRRKSRSRVRKSRSGGVSAAASSSAAVLGLHEYRRRKEKRETEGEKDDATVDPELGLVRYGSQPVYNQASHNAPVNPRERVIGRHTYVEEDYSPSPPPAPGGAYDEGIRVFSLPPSLDGDQQQPVVTEDLVTTPTEYGIGPAYVFPPPPTHPATEAEQRGVVDNDLEPGRSKWHQTGWKSKTVVENSPEAQQKAAKQPDSIQTDDDWASFAVSTAKKSKKKKKGKVAVEETLDVPVSQSQPVVPTEADGVEAGTTPHQVDDATLSIGSSSTRPPAVSVSNVVEEVD